MAACTFILNHDRLSTLITPVGMFAAFSGDGPHRNNPASVAVPDGGPIPGGMYHILDRRSGGRLGAVRDWALGRDHWFALYRDDGTIDDFTFVDKVSRGMFRLHPLGPRRMSTGCIVLQYPSEFDRLRAYLLAEPAEQVRGTAMRSYGILSVGQWAPDTRDRRSRMTGAPSRKGMG
jgi:hypothetical protein